MVQFLVKRFIGLIFVVIGVTFITFVMGYFAPGDPIRAMMGSHFDPVTYAQLRHAYGLDQPFFVQYWHFLTGLFRLDFGYSFEYQNQPVWDILKQGVPISAELGFWALVLSILIGVPTGIISALKANSWVDTTNMAIVLVMYALPVFVFAVFFQVIVVAIDTRTGAQWPVANWGNPWQYTWSDLQLKIGPIVILALASLAYYTRLTRTSMLEVLHQDYVRTARAKGMRERIVIYRHALRNALIPLVTVFGLSLGLIVTGTFFLEDIFNIPGIGEATLAATQYRDYPVIQATVVLLAVAVVIGNLISDILYTLVDPRIKAV
jgi:peptide/nickel transport system permease protein/oligopeptide transport system permease protein